MCTHVWPAAGMAILPQRCENAQFSAVDYVTPTALLVPAGNPQQVSYEVYDGDTGGSLGHFPEAAQAQKRADSMNSMTSRETGKRLDHPTDDADVE